MDRIEDRMVLVTVSGDIAGMYLPGFKDGPISDMSWAPFSIPRMRPEDLPPPGQMTHIEVNRWFGPQYFLERLREVWRNLDDDEKKEASQDVSSEDQFVAYVNVWMAILDHFGFDEDYQPSFFNLVRPVILEILVSGYREEPQESNPSNDRHFNDLIYSREDFQKEFNAFIIKHRLLF